MSFVRHSVFHRSDAARMGWDYGRRNDFQIEVGLANLAIGATGIAAWALGWGVHAEGTVVVVFGLYLLGAALLHGSEIKDIRGGGGRPVRPAPRHRGVLGRPAVGGRRRRPGLSGTLPVPRRPAPAPGCAAGRMFGESPAGCRSSRPRSWMGCR